MNLFNYHIDEYLSLKDEPYYDRGILPTEAFAFISHCRALKVDMVIESGTAFGQSCFLFAKYLNIPVHTIDDVSHYGMEAQNVAKERCKDLPVTFHIGNSFEILPRLLKEYSDKKIAVFIDGPKGELAKQFRQAIWDNPSVVLAALHDSVGENTVGKFSTANHPTYLSTYREVLDSKSLAYPYPDNPSITIGDRFKEGMGMDIWYKTRDVIYYVYTGGQDDLYRDFIQTSTKHCNPTYIALTNPDTVVVADYKTYFTEEEQGGTMGPKLNALRRLPLLEGDRVFVTDIDLYFNQNIFQVFNGTFEIGVTSRNRKEGVAAEYSPINAGVWAFTYSERTAQIFDWWYSELIEPSYDKWIEYKENHPYSKTIGLKEWWVDQDLLNVTFANAQELGIVVEDIGPEYNWIVSDQEFEQYKDKEYKVLHRKGGTGKRWTQAN